LSRRSRIRRHLTFANVASALALFLAIGGGTTAIALQGKNRVDSGDIRNSAVKTRDLANNAATGAKVNESTLTIVPNSDQLDGFSSEDFQLGNGQDAAITGGVPDNAQTGRIDLGTATLELECNGNDLVANLQDDAGAPAPSASAPTDVWLSGQHQQIASDGGTTTPQTLNLTGGPGFTSFVEIWDTIGVVTHAPLSAFLDPVPDPNLCVIVMPVQQNFDGGSPVNSSARASALSKPVTTGLVER